MRLGPQSFPKSIFREFIRNLINTPLFRLSPWSLVIWTLPLDASPYHSTAALLCFDLIARNSPDSDTVASAVVRIPSFGIPQQASVGVVLSVEVFLLSPDVDSLQQRCTSSQLSAATQRSSAGRQDGSPFSASNLRALTIRHVRWSVFEFVPKVIKETRAHSQWIISKAVTFSSEAPQMNSK